MRTAIACVFLLGLGSLFKPYTLGQTTRHSAGMEILGPTKENVLYGIANGQKLYLDIYEPNKRAISMPAVILIHGGGWTDFDKSIMSGIGIVLAHAGFVAFSINYRLLDYRDHPPRNRWPVQLEDCQSAVRWVREHAQEEGVNASRIGAFGHSAGGQLAALLGMTDVRDPRDTAISSRVQAWWT